MSIAEELMSLPSIESIEAAVDKGIDAVRERVAELVGDLPDGADAFWADGTERDNLVRIANLSLLGHARSAGPKEAPSDPFPVDVLANGARLVGRYVATVSIELGVTYQDLQGANNGLGPVFCRFAADRMERQEMLADAPRP